MKNEYDDKHFFEQYAQMTRSKDGLAGAGEWHQLKKMFPPLEGSRVLDLGCGYGWHCKYAVDQGAEEVLGIDVSRRMIEEAKRRNADKRITYQTGSLEDYEYPAETWDCVVSNLAFLFNIEHPVFTAGVDQEWICDEKGKALYWPVDGYFYPGERKTHFLGCEVLKYHHTLTQIMNGLIRCGFVIEMVVEAEPPEEMMDLPGMKDEMRRPMMLMIRAEKK